MGCVNMRGKPVIWPNYDNYLPSDLIEAQAWSTLANLENVETMVIGVDGDDDDETHDGYSPIRNQRTIKDVQDARAFAKEIGSSKLVVRPALTITAPFYVVFLDQFEKPIAAVSVIDGMFQPMRVRSRLYGWEVKYLFGFQIRHLRGSVGQWEPYFRSKLRW
jgi:hypothetical protein